PALLCVPQLLGPSATRRERWFCMAGILGIALYFVFPALRYAVYGFGHVAFRFSSLWVSVLILVLGLAGLRRAMHSGSWRPGNAMGAIRISGISVACVIQLPNTVNVHYVALVLAMLAVYVGFMESRDLLARQPDAALRILVAVLACELLLTGLPSILNRD